MKPLSAALLGLVAGLAAFLVCGLLVSAAVKAEPTVTWVRLQPPASVGDTYVSFLPCARTSGWLLPVLTCFPTESRSKSMTLHGTNPDPDCRLADPVVACREAR